MLTFTHSLSYSHLYTFTFTCSPPHTSSPHTHHHAFIFTRLPLAGSLSGLVGGIAANFIVASTYDGGLANFLPNTSENYAVLAGSCCAFGVSVILTIVLSLLTHRIRSPEDEMVGEYSTVPFTPYDTVQYSNNFIVFWRAEICLLGRQSYM